LLRVPLFLDGCDGDGPIHLSLVVSNEDKLAVDSPRRRILTRWKLRNGTLELGGRTLVCGVLNLTSDSFSDGGAFLEPHAAVAHALQMLDDGADLLDLGAESTRPGSRAGGEAPAVSTEQEQTRLLPVIEAILKARPEAILSVDTYKAETARAVLQAGAQIINDVSGFHWDPAMPHVCARASCGLILMHTRGRPGEWAAQSQLGPDDLLHSVQSGLEASVAMAAAAGIAGESIVLDPGYGFGKRGDENFALLSRQSELLGLGRPLLAGLSRKSFLGRALSPLHAGQVAPVNARDAASLAAAVAAILHGASVIRTHRVRETAEAALTADAVLRQMVQGRKTTPSQNNCGGPF
jgi:dihydropteroate synthase